ncbi:hypothetical protein [Helicobacter turcicus]|uniref:Uncharacterized protein n=1 Tax=Helicobacter turcicus TaxID=2867412 RepID=A0ABS7JPD1_9HELI|nr:hypothetical protein [Helicobacter turcicus]MBX7491261.1 hypothetical protein [Helicobacter turcicus]MBX7546100.1 hypothetical protein [Helicobacter turcicus]
MRLKVFSGNNRTNDGSTDNHCTEETLKYFAGLYDEKEDSLKRKAEVFNKLEALNIDNIEANIIKIVNE